MKPSFLNALALFVAVLLIGAGGPWLVREMRSLPRPTTLAARADQRIVTLEVAGMTCAMCSSAIEGRLAEVPGVSSFEIRIPQSRAFVVCDKSLPDTALTAAVDRAGPGFLASVVAR
jgi:copper chaperone CopZ